MTSRAGRTLALLAATAVVASTAAPALAEEPAGPPVDVPAALEADLSAAEERALDTLTEDGGDVPVSALVETPDGVEIVSLDADSEAAADEAAALLGAQPSVQAADVAVRVRATAGTQVQYGNEMVRAETARATVGDALADVVVAVLDTGVSAHPELAAALLPGYNTVPGEDPLDASDVHGHGTHVAGTIGADAGSTVEGVAAGVRILPVKVLDDSGGGYSSSIAAGIVWAADHDADVINLSLGGYGSDEVMAAAVEYARGQGVTVVAAAGNFNRVDPFYPAAYEGVVGVSAVDAQQAKAYFSNFGSFVDVAGPGVDIWSTVVGGSVGTKSGTSMAAPHVAAIAGLVKAAGPGLTPDEVELVLEGTATDLGTPGRDDAFGRGLVDAVRAVDVAPVLDGTGLWPGNDAPVAPDRALTSQYTPGRLHADVPAWASDPDGDALTIEHFSQGTHGEVRRDGAGLAWLPLRSGPYTDTFTYTVDDGFGGSATGTVAVTVGAPDPANGTPVAVDDPVVATYESESVIPNYTANDADPDGDPLRIVGFTQPANGSVTMDWDGLRYRKPAGVSGAAFDRYSYTVTDDRGRFATAEVIVDVRTPNTLPVAVDDEFEVVRGSGPVYLDVTSNDSDPDDPLWVWEVGTAQHGEVSRTWTHAIYTPDDDSPAGTTDSFTYTLYDQEWVPVQATVHLTVVEPAAPSAPVLGSVTPGKGSLVVRWGAPTDPGSSAVLGYWVTVHQGGGMVSDFSAGGDARSATVTGLANGRPHRVSVVAYNAEGYGPVSASSAAVTPRTVPAARKIGAAGAARRAAVVRWSAPASNGGATIDGYVIQVFSGGKLVKAVAAGPAARSLTVGRLTPGKAYAFRVLARNAAGLGARSALSAKVVPRR